MHPAYSVIFFTTASGAGYGLLMLLCLCLGFGVLAPSPGFVLVGFGSAFALVTTGLLSSTAHLGRPERAWRAFSQWRTSWLSREGVLALATYPVAGLAALAWHFPGALSAVPLAVISALAGLLALATVVATGQIYASLPTIRHWHQPTTTPVYVVLALATGGLLLNLVSLAFGQGSGGVAWLVVSLLLCALALKTVHWLRIDAEPRLLTAGDATGLGHLGRVRPLDPPHTQANYVMREMGFAVARKHAARLRAIAGSCLFGLPILLTVMTLPGVGLPPLPCAVLAVLSAALGVFVERWLFFAEAQHVVTLYYGAGRA